MHRGLKSAVIGTLAALALAGCGAGRTAERSSTSATSSTATSAVPQGHPQAVNPSAGAQAVISPDAGAPPLGDTNAHAPPLAQVKRELIKLNLCGGATSAAEARPVVANAGPGFVADPGTVQDVGQLPELTARLNSLAQALHVTIYGISGYRTPAHSVAVGGFADDPHTKGEAEDIGVNSLLRSSAAQISEPQLARYGLYRPFDPTDNPANTEVNHIQLIPSGGPVPVVVAEATFAPDPTCK
ncbi:MAG TPA: D-Ala-D-Ala carboxypeptidase family metallohydrolase [Solirubrobacteraceae bacterium]|nr:D-Ala-D-Ala carboxypeptidase family metallohydrolase [Solirubrobacteraceae bacterium]